MAATHPPLKERLQGRGKEEGPSSAAPGSPRAGGPRTREKNVGRRRGRAARYPRELGCELVYNSD